MTEIEELHTPATKPDLAYIPTDFTITTAWPLRSSAFHHSMANKIGVASCNAASSHQEQRL
ncbi:MAG: hypothetical protein WBD67_12550 [Terracidiphilus sp.]